MNQDMLTAAYEFAVSEVETHKLWRYWTDSQEHNLRFTADEWSEIHEEIKRLRCADDEGPIQVGSRVMFVHWMTSEEIRGIVVSIHHRDGLELANVMTNESGGYSVQTWRCELDA